jgi:hypothetical protein
MALTAIIRIPEPENKVWKGAAEVTSVSRTGCNFSTSHACYVGRLIEIVMETPGELRDVEPDANTCSLVGMVQSCHAVVTNGRTMYNVGLAFIGKDAPESFKKDPLQTYRITGMRPDGMWAVSHFQKRKHSRYSVKVPLGVVIVDAIGKTSKRASATTVNVSPQGVSIITELDRQVGEKMKLAFDELDFFCIAVVRGSQPQPGRNILHLQLLDAEFPLRKLFPGETNPNMTPLQKAAWEFFYV